MAQLLYGGQAFALPDDVGLDDLADVLSDSYAKGEYSWISMAVAAPSAGEARLLVGPGIPVAILDATSEDQGQ